MDEVSILLLVYVTRILGQQEGISRTLDMPFCVWFRAIKSV